MKSKSSALTRIVFVVYLMVLGSATTAFALSGADEHVNAYYDLPPAPSGGWYNIDMNVYPLNNPVAVGSVKPAFYYASYFQFGGSGAGCGYMGLQTDSKGKRAIFSIWGSTHATGPVTPVYFTENGCNGYSHGWQLLLPFNWTTHVYKLRIWRLGASNYGTDWGAWVIDTSVSPNVETWVGTISVPASWTGLKSNVVAFDEWYGGDIPSCSGMPRSQVAFAPPTANAASVSAPASSYIAVGGACPGQGSQWGTLLIDNLPR